jgi:CBS domain-containing protein
MRRLSDIVFDQKPLVLPPSSSVKEACVRMRDRRVGAVLVADSDGTLCGIFTGRDVLNRVVAEGKSPSKTRLSAVMTTHPKTMPPGKTAIEALRLMWDGGFRHIPIIADGKIAGVVSRGDFQACEANRLEEERELWEHMR